ncbi:MAG: hypothetical protein WAK57_19625 [Desulfobacterales bacterium]
MTNLENSHKIEEIRRRVLQWVRDGRDPVMASWQGALESTLVTMNAYLMAGHVVTVENLSESDLNLFQALHLTLDISPFVVAVFLPPAITRSFGTGEIPEQVQRTAPGAPSAMLLLSRAGDFGRIVAAELSPEAHKPGIDIFEGGQLLGSFDYGTPGECIRGLSRVIWVHLKTRATWRSEQIVSYTEGWFRRSAANRITDLPVTPQYSYIHHPELLQMDLVQAIFRLVRAALFGLLDDPDRVIRSAGREALAVTREALARRQPEAITALREFFVAQLVFLLKLLSGYRVADFQALSEREKEAFYTAFDETVEGVLKTFLSRIDG